MASAEVTRPQAVPVVAPPLRVTFSWTLVGNVIYAGCQWGMISVLAKLGNTTAVGQFALALAITAPIFMLTNLSLRGVQATDSRAEFEFADYLTLRVVCTGVALLAVCLSLTIMQRGRLTAGAVIFVALAKAIESLTDVIAGLLQKHERLDQVAISMMLKGLFSLVTFGLAYAYWKSVVAASVALFVSWTTVFVVYDVQRARRLLGKNKGYFRWSASRVTALAKLALPVGIVMGLASLNVNIPRYLVEHYRGTSQLGIFAALAYLVVAAGLIVNALGQSAVVRLSRNFADGKLAEYVHLLRRMCLAAVAGTIVGVLITSLIGRSVLLLAYGREYEHYLGVLLVLVAASGTTAVAAFLGYGMTAARRFRQQLPVMVATLTICGVCSLVSIPRWGVMGAALSILLASSAQVMGAMLVIKNALKARRRGDLIRNAEAELALGLDTVIGVEPDLV